MNSFTNKEKETLVRFRAKLKDVDLKEEWNEDSYLIKWLRARNLSLSKAEFMFREHLKWRKTNKIDEILSWDPPEILRKIYPFELCGFSKLGCPIIVISLRYFDINQFWKCTKKDIIRYQAQNMEKLLKLCREISTLEKSITEAVVIYDLEGLNFGDLINPPFMEFMQSSSKQFNDNYPEMIQKAYFVCIPNAKLFQTFWGIFKHVVPKKTLEKFEIYGSKKEKWMPSLLKQMDLNVIPKRLGGTNVEFDQRAFLGLQLPPKKDDANETSNEKDPDWKE